MLAGDATIAMETEKIVSIKKQRSIIILYDLCVISDPCDHMKSRLTSQLLSTPVSVKRIPDMVFYSNSMLIISKASN